MFCSGLRSVLRCAVCVQSEVSVLTLLVVCRPRLFSRVPKPLSVRHVECGMILGRVVVPMTELRTASMSRKKKSIRIVIW